MRPFRSFALILMLFLYVSPALSDETAVSGDDSEETTDTAELLLDSSGFEKDTLLSDEELNSHRARENIKIESVTVNDQNQEGDVTDNVAIDNTNGDNLINGNAFSGTSGFMSTVQNTGNNVLIQNSTIINVSVDAPGK